MYPRTGGSSFVMENLCKNLQVENFVIIHEEDFFFRKKHFERRYRFPLCYTIKSKFSFKNRGERFVSFFRVILIPFNLYQVIKIFKRHGIQNLFCIYPNGYYMVLTWLLVKVVSFDKLGLYYHNSCIENKDGVQKLVLKYVQESLMEMAQVIYTMSEGLNESFKEQYLRHKKKFHVLQHMYHFENLQESNHNTINGRVLFTGNFNDSNMEATVRMVNVLSKFNDIEIRFTTPVPKSLLQLRGIDCSKIKYLGYLKEDVYRKELFSADYVVLTHGFQGGYSEFEYKTIFPTRTLPLLQSSGCLIVHAPRNSFLFRFFDQRDACLLLPSKDEKKLISDLKSLFNDIEMKERLMKNKIALQKYFQPENVMKNFEIFLNES